MTMPGRDVVYKDFEARFYRSILARRGVISTVIDEAVELQQVCSTGNHLSLARRKQPLSTS